MTSPEVRLGQPLAGQVALVTGASRGIGRTIAEELVSAGAAVVAGARSAPELEHLQADIESRGGEALAVAADLREPGELVRLIRSACQWRDRLDIVVNAAGTTRRTDEFETSYDDWDAIFQVNVRSTYFVCQEAARYVLSGTGTASFVNVASVAAVAVTGANAAYGASKAALVQMTRVLAARWAPRIRVNAVGPAYVETELNRAWLAIPDNREFVIRHTPMGRLGTAEDVARAVSFLASPAAGYVTGQHLLLDGGWTCA
jgi:NAD(P)-dependent dehydrogenase (short-subunit alcohol dehydrogenase family)